MTQAVGNPFDFLGALDRRGRQRLAVLPASEEVRYQWTGVGFRLAGSSYVASMDEVAEILTCPPLLRIPHTKTWVKGLANVRGNLLPIMDLSDFLGRRPIVMTSTTRVMVIQQAGIYVGLLVDEVLGMRHFFDEERMPPPDETEGMAQEFVSGAFEREEGTWLLFSMRALAVDPQFLKVAA